MDTTTRLVDKFHFINELNRNKFDPILCDHPQDSFYIQFDQDGDRLLKCTQCPKSLSLRDLFCFTLVDSLNYVHLYVKWTHDYSIPCCFTPYPLQNRVLTHEIIVRYNTLLRGCKLLQILHAPLYFDHKPSLDHEDDIHFFHSTLEAGLKRILEVCRGDSSSVGILVRNILVFIQHVVESRRYFTDLVPYVKRAYERHSGLQHTYAIEQKDNCLRNLVETLLIQSARFDTQFSRFNLSFDAVHVAVLCYFCQDNLDTVYDLLLDFLCKVCHGHYDQSASILKSPDDLKSKIRALFTEYISAGHNITIHRHLHVCSMGNELEDNLSENFSRGTGS